MCRVCEVELTDDNWASSRMRSRRYICKECERENNRLYREKNRDKINAKQRLDRKENPEKTKAIDTRKHRKAGHLSFDENKECALYYGVYINEGLLKLYFDDVEVMPFCNIGYDFVCSNGWKIDGKSSFTGDKGHWMFNINHNTIPDYFFCVAYNNRKDKNVIHIWMLPGDKFNHLVGARISKSTIGRWSEYEQPLDKIIACCDSMKTK